MANNYCRNVDAAILCYNLSESSSIRHLDDWYDYVCKQCACENFAWAIIGTKSDGSENDIEVEENDVKLLRNRIGTDLNFLVSSKTGHNVDYALEKIITAVHKLRKTSNPVFSQSFKLERGGKSSSGCC